MSGAKAIAIIPARLGSTRFPGKVLADATGKPLIQHVAEAAARARSINRVVIATDDRSVISRMAEYGAECILTSPDHPNGTSRLAEAAKILELSEDQIVVNVQGDEPELDPSLIDTAVDALIGSRTPVSTIAVSMARSAGVDPNIVKVVRRSDGTALYFSRALIPCHRDSPTEPSAMVLRHIGLYAYRRSFLEVYQGLAPTPLERAEMLEQLRILEHGFNIAVAVCNESKVAIGIDTPAQYEAFVARWNAQNR